MATDRQGATVAEGDVYLLAGKVVRIEGTRVLVRDAAGKLRHVDAGDIVKVDATVAGGGGGHDPVTVTDTASINLTLTGQDIQASAIFGSGSGQVCQGNDARLSDARTPTPHDHVIGDVTDLQSELDAINFALVGKAATSHTHASTDIVSVTTDRLIGRDTAGTGAAEQLTVGGGVEFTGTGGIQRSALTGDVTASAGSASTTIASNAVSDAKLRDSAALSVIGRSANSTGDPADIATAADGDVLRRSGTTLGFGTIATAGIADNAVTNAKIRDSAALSVIGRSANSTGDPADIATAADGDVLRRSGTTLGFGTIVPASIGTVTTDRLLGRDTASTGTAEEIAVGGNLEFTGSGGIQRGALTGAVTASAGSGTTAFGSFKANAILMNMTTSSGVPTAVDGVDAASNLLAYLGGSFIVPAWSQSTLALGGLAI